ncbi:helix-turn-helix domain-containing protein [Streptococcus moroccensis]|uniref:AraC-like DNA-binding protein n=1 Tax=Streptococcus moroccensis TaxID=1451356 RepID=A0ABT9YQF6_9STRE|nr:helix-turn-helix domain-containing protein [Streptococcus moroccensis]MDQ0221826.1 AraC-like DNA-binding protein [Streptococcus moroccensis]
MTYSNQLTFLQKLLLSTHIVYYWQLDESYQLNSTNCPYRTFGLEQLIKSTNIEMITDHFKHHSSPLILCEQTGLVWLILYEKRELSSLFHILGPIFISDESENQLLHFKQKDKKWLEDFLYHRSFFPVINLRIATSLLGMLHYTIYSETLETSTIVVKVQQPISPITEPEWQEKNWHGTWQIEQKLFKAIQNGDLNLLNKTNHQTSSGTVGNMAPSNPLRQSKNEIIVLIVLASRAAIFGGMSPETSYNLSDYYIQKIETSRTISEVIMLSKEIVETFVKRVNKLQKSRNFSQLTRDVINYIQQNITEKISLEALSNELGYTPYYLSQKFKKETQQSINSYILNEKMEEACSLLKNTQIPIAEISHYLSFSSPSYFSEQFKKKFHQTPLAYRNSL